MRRRLACKGSYATGVAWGRFSQAIGMRALDPSEPSHCNSLHCQGSFIQVPGTRLAPAPGADGYVAARRFLTYTSMAFGTGSLTMRSFRLAAAGLVLLATVGCGGGDGPTPPPDNVAPTADFTVPTCVQLSCTFVDDLSSDSDGDIASRSWTFESGTPATSEAETQAVTFTAAGTYTVTLTVTDDDGDTDDVSKEVTVSATEPPPPANVPPSANFTYTCNALTCTFTDASADSDGSIAAYSWDFADPNSTTDVSTDANPQYTYSNTELQNFDVTLTVTDDDGASDVVTQTVAVAPPAQTSCDAGDGTFTPCTLDIEQNATVTITLTARDCTANGNRLRITAPIQATVFTNGCSEPIGTVYTINGGTAFTAGTQLVVQVTSGSNDPGRIAPAIRVSGGYPSWTLNFDDGEDPTAPGEPDFNDLVLTVNATATP